MSKKMNFSSKIYLALVYFFLYAPIIVLVVYSFNASSSTSVLSGFSFKWYAELFNDADTITAVKNTLVIAIVSSVIATVLGTAAAVGIDKLKNKFVRSAIMNVTNIPMMNPEIVTGISLLLLFVFGAKLMGMKSVLGLQTLIVAHITFVLPYVILSVLPKLRQLDKYLPEAAMDLGCTSVQAFFKVILPSISTGIFSGLMMSFTLSLDDFVISYFTQGPSFETLPIRIFSMTKKRVTPDMYALSTLIFLIILVLLILLNVSQVRGEKKMKNKLDKGVKQ